MNINKDENSQEDVYMTLEELAPILSESNYLYLGHGTRSEDSKVVDSIFDNGLRTKNGSLYYTTLVLDAPTPELIKTYEEYGMDIPTIDSLKHLFNNWPHCNSKEIIIARLPMEYVNKKGNSADLDGEMYGAFYTERLQENGKSINYLDSRFIVGCYDVDRQMVRMNKKFERSLSEETINWLKLGYEKTVAKTEARLDRQNKQLLSMFDSFDVEDNIEFDNLSQNFKK